jgi:hypothetical protein
VSDDASERHPDPADDDLDVGLRNRLRDARGGGEMTRQELLELAEALTRQRQEMAKALADLSRREQAAAEVRGELERASREAADALDERDARLAALAEELGRERARLEQRERALEAEAAAPAPPAHGLPEALETVLGELRDRLDRVEAAIAERVRTVPEALLGPDREERMARAIELVSELAHVLRRPLEAMRGNDEERRDAPPEPVAANVVESQPVAAAAVEPEREPQPTVPGHVLFVATDAGYRVFEREGDAPARGERVVVAELDDGEVVVTGLRASPFPGDRRRCLVCEPSLGV